MNSSSPSNPSLGKKPFLTPYEIAIFAMLGALMFLSKKLMEWIPNVHMVGMLIMTYTLVYRKKALIPIYLYVLLDGIFGGFNAWWLPYLYIWAILWGVTMLLPQNMPRGLKIVIYPLVCALHGFAFGTLYAPAQALMFHLDWKGMLAWIAAGLPFDALHGLGNLGMGLLIVPFSKLLTMLERRRSVSAGNSPAKEKS